MINIKEIENEINIEIINFTLCVYFILIIYYEFYVKLEKEKNKITKENFGIYKDFLINLAKDYELIEGFKNKINYNEYTYIKFKLPEIKKEIELYNKDINKYYLINNSNNQTNNLKRFKSSNGLSEYKIIKWYNNEYSEKYFNYFKILKKINYDIPNIGFCLIININKNDIIQINKLGLHLINSMFICLNGSIDIKKDNYYQKCTPENSSIIMINKNITLKADNINSTILYIEFMSHSVTDNSKFIWKLYKYFLSFL